MQDKAKVELELNGIVERLPTYQDKSFWLGRISTLMWVLGKDMYKAVPEAESLWEKTHAGT